MKPYLPLPAFRDRVTIRARQICREIRCDLDPVMIPYQKIRGAKGGECFQNVRNYVERFGGEVVDGWVVWETPPLLVQAEFHSVWLRPDRVLVDVTPPLHRGHLTTFLRAVPGDTYKGLNRSAVYLPYDDTDLARRFVALSRRFSALVYPEGEIQTTQYTLTSEIREITIKKAQIFHELQNQRL